VKENSYSGKLSEVRALSGLSEAECIERALNLWLEIYRLDSDGWKATMKNRYTGIVQQVNDWELIKEDPNKSI
jgi:hypothetical protein